MGGNFGRHALLSAKWCMSGMDVKRKAIKEFFVHFFFSSTNILYWQYAVAALHAGCQKNIGRNRREYNGLKLFFFSHGVSCSTVILPFFLSHSVM